MKFFSLNHTRPNQRPVHLIQKLLSLIFLIQSKQQESECQLLQIGRHITESLKEGAELAAKDLVGLFAIEVSFRFPRENRRLWIRQIIFIENQIGWDGVSVLIHKQPMRHSKLNRLLRGLPGAAVIGFVQETSAPVYDWCKTSHSFYIVFEKRIPPKFANKDIGNAGSPILEHNYNYKGQQTHCIKTAAKIKQ
ncbi:hypothetical protein AXF13_08305 [Desulfovibrio fairfieldensis]|uniref:Uncharacterized protein n=1 Tax=Desulfovibrio fairfieldensis TaxID=44742 RepID=A0A120KM34_9BACT|nr:hypothetical protein AXF13_08305 [Desulfovibrio fairfieldensis]